MAYTMPVGVFCIAVAAVWIAMTAIRKWKEDEVNKAERVALWIIAGALAVLAGTSVVSVLEDDRIAEARVEAIDRQATAVRASCVANARTRIPASFTPQAFDSELLLIITVCMSDAPALSEFAENALETIRNRVDNRASP